ncbi:MAG TPA: class I SAM-dependent methyltransferase, partial [Candidatus Angelobacter sp.]|nr:class I SAM-dependent methyltransferase [Candidatus Angelobacter sp.]
MTRQFIFDQAVQSELRDAKGAFLRRVVSPWKSALGLQTAFDTGCGVGYFSGVLQELGLRVAAADGRAENVAEARERYPSIDFRVADAESASPDLGTFDLVLCFGLLYHLENPLRAMRNLRALTGKILL